MNNFNVAEDFPETYIYNNYSCDSNRNTKDSNIVIDIDKVVYDILQCGRDRERFDFIMESLEKEFLGDDRLSEEESGDKKSLRRSETVNQELVNSYSRKGSGFSKISGGGMKSDRTIDSEKNIQNFNYQPNVSSSRGNIPQSTNKNSSIPVYHKKYTDVHANTKFYYPSDYYNNPYDDADIDFEPSQWTDRANRSTLLNQSYNNKSLNSTHLAMEGDYYDYNMGMHSNKFNRDNTNSALLNMQMNRRSDSRGFKY